MPPNTESEQPGHTMAWGGGRRNGLDSAVRDLDDPRPQLGSRLRCWLGR